AIVKTGQVCQFYTEVSRLGLQGHAPHPPRSLVASLGREVEKYDQLCDAMEAHLVRAIAVLQRDIDRERNRLKEAELAAKASEDQKKAEKQEAAASALPASPSSEQATQLATEDVSRQPPPNRTPQMTPPSGALAPSHSGRRPSAISLSSLHRPAFPHKLDLSSTALKLDETDILGQNPLASPVTLAPRSARPTAASEFPPDFLTALASADASERSVDIDLSGSDPVPSTSHETGAGSSADMPIELDLDMDLGNSANLVDDMAKNLFRNSAPSDNNANASVQDLMNQAQSASAGLDGAGSQQQDGMDIFNALSSSDQTQEGHEIFGSLHGPEQGQENPPQGQSHLELGSGMPSSSNSAPSPGSILAGLNPSSAAPDAASQSMDQVPALGTPFGMNLDLSNMSNFDPDFDFGQAENPNFAEMEALFDLTGEPEGERPKEGS
ncbi:hypothetical protein GLOTRDRAFT_32415, partial [Gloeophyllum trabeum ATCC 11539]